MNAVVSHRTGSRVPEGEATAALVAGIGARLRESDRLVLPLEESLELLDRLREFELGRFLLHNQGLNGFWTAYIFRHPQGAPGSCPTEDWLLNRSLLSGARERFHRFKATIARHVTDGAVLASIPCGLMDDLLEQDYSGVRDVRVVGMDIDPESLALAKENAESRGLGALCEFGERDAWDLGRTAEFDLLVSNGLNMYESDPDRLRLLYRNFAQALKPGGSLLLSFLTPPPPPPWVDESRVQEWDKYGIEVADLQRELALFGDIVQAKYLNFTPEAEVRQMLAEAGLVIESVDYSATGVLPIITARKPG
ncbi:SAM-dependent methyltransferase [Crossiella equi]|uniref:SAM-dependent methyltransferase n=1 Tax=Crossiella equi TaxID=130796 RepID=A0ABS5AP91_9PSEU|nr:class I SAM-dependent methyltransferase [Crossiella equi]MBP2478403.1 SAM-dependent methyltransferase [Crossiella equi]